MKKFIVSTAVMEATGFKYILLRERESYEDAEIAYKVYKRRNPGCLNNPFKLYLMH